VAGIRLASDGNVYFASSTHSAHHGAAFFKYDSKTAQVARDRSRHHRHLRGRRPDESAGKIHSDVVEANELALHGDALLGRRPGAFKNVERVARARLRDRYGKDARLRRHRPGFTAYSGSASIRCAHLYVFVTGQTKGQARTSIASTR
jgi:hypothetical protein